MQFLLSRSSLLAHNVTPLPLTTFSSSSSSSSSSSPSLSSSSSPLLPTLTSSPLTPFPLVPIRGYKKKGGRGGYGGAGAGPGPGPGAGAGAGGVGGGAGGVGGGGSGGKPGKRAFDDPLKDPKRAMKRPADKPIRHARETTLAAVNDDERALPWENEADSDEVPIEQRALYREMDLQRQSVEAEAREIMKMPDYNFYKRVLHDRMQEVELRMANQKLPFDNEYRSTVDAMLQEVIYSTQEEFHAYYKRVDERRFAAIEARLEALTDPSKDPGMVKFMLESETKTFELERADTELLLNAPNLRVSDVPDDLIYEDEVDDDDIMSEDEELDPVLIEQPQLASDPLYVLASYKKPLPPKAKHFEFKGDDANHDRLEGNVYKGYEDLRLYKQEMDHDYNKGFDLIDAHFIARERKRIKKVRHEHEESINADDNIKDFMDLLAKEPTAQLAFERSISAKKSDLGILNDVPAPEDLTQMAQDGKMEARLNDKGFKASKRKTEVDQEDTQKAIDYFNMIPLARDR